MILGYSSLNDTYLFGIYSFGRSFYQLQVPLFLRYIFHTTNQILANPRFVVPDTINPHGAVDDNSYRNDVMILSATFVVELLLLRLYRSRIWLFFFSLPLITCLQVFPNTFS